MKIRTNLFIKIMLVLSSMIAATLIFYGISFQKNVAVITGQITSSELNHLDFFTRQMESNINQLAGNAYTLQHDPTIRSYVQMKELGRLVDPNKITLTALEKLALQTSSSTWSSRITVFNVHTREAMSSDSTVSFQSGLLQKPLPQGWTYEAPETANGEGSFHLLLADPVDYADTPERANMIIEVSFPVSNLQKLMADYQHEGGTFLYHAGLAPIESQQSASSTVRGIVSGLPASIGTAPSSFTAIVDDKPYLVSQIPSATLGWSMMHYTPLEQILSPIRAVKLYFIVACLALLAFASVFSLLLFRQVQHPISRLLSAVNQLKHGRWSTRVHSTSRDEFSVLNRGFNEMAEQVQDLIERVYLEELRTKDAYLKQLQAQINPHFLYNCLFFMKSKAKVGDTDAVEAMALNLGEYYRYMTRIDRSLTTVRQELKLLDNYLSIQNLRKQRIEYTVDISPELLDIQIPNLLIQPLVENSIVHGIERKNGLGRIHISGRPTGDGFLLAVEDNGAGMDADGMDKLCARLALPARAEGEGGYGLWNVHQRLKHHYGGASGLSVAPSALGGMRITLDIHMKDMKES
ncbi:sensor histidine kinase [Paenibacillus athensensis]|uniref:HAMP domain-containing protein n=1 Tax=Paenibacillus athensensis TaxID=1967502 RepID=A0A4Y8PZK7_9BACL|nr:sensor histidine kinase [Paenibacillus athensensis]MCD1259679.1 sensor histidine kinase [Paenibacillus athensensis]